MSETCENCPLNGRNVSDGTLARSWQVLAEHPQKLRALTSEGLSEFDSDEARASQDSRVVRMVNSHAIAACYVKRVITGTCETSALYGFVNADFMP